jgi:hypothetical protein
MWSKLYLCTALATSSPLCLVSTFLLRSRPYRMRQAWMPSEISLEIEGMHYDWQPDGSGKKWDNRNNPHVKINSVRLLVPLSAIDVQPGIDVEPFAPNRSPTRVQIQELTSTLQHLEKICGRDSS